jgi:diketogulonate reductase-like aldo/keto reductase
MNPSWHQRKLREFCMQKGIHVCAWSPLGAYKVFWGSNAVMENPILQEIAEARKKSVAQVQLILYLKLFSMTTLNYIVLNKLF